MKKLIFILLFIFFSCDSIDQLGVEEYEESFNYFDYVAYAWVDFFNGSYDSSISYFEEALLIEDVDQDGTADNMRHSAYVGLSWAKTMRANTDISDINNEDNNNIRDEAIKYLCYYINNQGAWNIEGNCEENQLINTSDNQAILHYDINQNQSGITFCEQEYCCTDCFVYDKKVALIYYYSYKFYYFNSIDEIQQANQYYNLAISLGLDFLSSIQDVSLLDKNLDYDFQNGKPNVGTSFILNRNTIITLISQLYLKNEEYSNAATILINGNVCENLNDINNYTVEDIIDCLENL